MKSVDILVGCQFGSEAKGLVAGQIAKEREYDLLVSVNSAQAGHTVYKENEEGEVQKYVLRQLPAAAIINTEAKIYIATGSVINPEVLIKEVQELENRGIPVLKRLMVSSRALIITEGNINVEKANDLQGRLGSTCEGVGSAISSRVARVALLVRDIRSELEAVGIGVVDHLPYGGHNKIFLEGSQGFGLSNFSGYYPFCTSRDTTASAFLSYAELPPQFVRDVFGVYRTFPIRVGGNSGDMKDELTWERLAEMSGYDELSEYTTVTGRLRRVGAWDNYLALMATSINGVTKPVLTFCNYFDKKIENKSFNKWPASIKKRITEMANHIGFEGWWGVSANRLEVEIINAQNAQDI